MKTRLLGALTGLAISFALPIYAQQKDLADPQTTQKILALMKAVNEAQNNSDPAARVALYTRDAVCYARWGPNHRSASHSEMVYRRVPVVAPQKQHPQG